MSNPLPTPQPPENHSQFSLRAAFLLVTVASVIFAYTAWRTQSMTNATRVATLMHLVVALFCAIVGGLVAQRLIRDQSRRAGQLITISNSRASRFLGLFSSLFGTFLIWLLIETCDQGLSTTSHNTILWPVMLGFGIGQHFVVAYAWLTSRYRVYENGIWCAGLTSWKWFTCYRWDDSSQPVKLRLGTWSGYFDISFEIETADRIAVQKVLNEAGIKHTNL